MGKLSGSFKIDTEGEVSAISKDVFKAIGRPTLQKWTKLLCDPDRSPLKVLDLQTHLHKILCVCYSTSQQQLTGTPHNNYGTEYS